MVERAMAGVNATLGSTPPTIGAGLPPAPSMDPNLEALLGQERERAAGLESLVRDLVARQSATEQVAKDAREADKEVQRLHGVGF